MGIGIITLGLWLLFGIKISINDINIIPPMIAYAFIIWGTTIVLKKYKNKKLMISYVLSYVLLLLEIPDYFITTLISIILSYIHLYLLLNGILEIAYDYPDIDYMKHKFRNYLIIFLIINIATFIIYLFEITDVTFTSFLIVIYAIMTIPMIYRLSKINNYLYSQNEPIKIDKPIPRNRKNKLIALLSITISIVFFIISQTIIINMNQTQTSHEFVFLKGESENIKVEYAGIHYCSSQESMFIKTYESYQLRPQFYMKDELLDNIQSLDYTITTTNGEFNTKSSLKPIVNNDKNVLQYEHYQNFLLQGNEEDDDYIDIFENIDIDDNFIRNIKNETIEINITFTLIDQNNNQTKETIYLHPIQVKEYGYKDKNIEIDFVFTDGNIILSRPNIYIKKSFIEYDEAYISFNNKDGFVEIRSSDQYNYINKGNELMYQILENNDLKITIELYNNDILIDTQTYQLEELQ